MDESKKPWESKTIVIGAVSSVVSGVAMLVPHLSIITDWIGSHGAVIGMVWGVLAVLLRLVSKGSISLSD